MPGHRLVGAEARFFRSGGTEAAPVCLSRGHWDKIDAKLLVEMEIGIIPRVQIRGHYGSMRRIIVAPGQCICALLVMIAIGGGCFAEDTPSPLNTREVEVYRQIAHRIFERIVALKDRYPHLASIDSAARSDEARDKLWIAYHYTHGMSWTPNPNYNPHTKGGRELKLFSAKDGIELNLYFYEGEWMGQAVVRPLHIGAMNVVTFIEGRETASVGALRRDIGHIVADEMNRFDHQHQNAKALLGAQK